MEFSGDEHFVPNKVKSNEARHLSSRPVSKVAVYCVLNHLPEFFDALRLRDDRMPKARRHKSPIYFVFTYFKDDLLHISPI